VDEILSRCGYRCDLCLAYRANVEANPSNQQVLSDGWHKYFSLRIAPDELVCDGCMADTPQIDRGCPVRPCVINKGLVNCSECDEYGCEGLAERWVVFKELEAAVGSPIPDEDRARFIFPYENRARLDALRKQRG